MTQAAKPRKTLALPPASYDTTAAAMFLAQQLTAAGRADVAALLVKNELNARLDKKQRRAQKRVTLARFGKGVRGGAGFANLDNPDIEIVEVE